MTRRDEHDDEPKWHFGGNRGTQVGEETEGDSLVTESASHYHELHCTKYIIAVYLSILLGQLPVAK